MKKKEEEIRLRKENIALCQEKEETSRKQMQSFQEEKDKKNNRHKEMFTKRDELSNRIGLLDKECFRLKSQIEKIEETRKARSPICGRNTRSHPTTRLSTGTTSFPTARK